ASPQLLTAGRLHAGPNLRELLLDAGPRLLRRLQRLQSGLFRSLGFAFDRVALSPRRLLPERFLLLGEELFALLSRKRKESMFLLEDADAQEREHVARRVGAEEPPQDGIVGSSVGLVLSASVRPGIGDLERRDDHALRCASGSGDFFFELGEPRLQRLVLLEIDPEELRAPLGSEAPRGEREQRRELLARGADMLREAACRVRDGRSRGVFARILASIA